MKFIKNDHKQSPEVFCKKTFPNSFVIPCFNSNILYSVHFFVFLHSHKKRTDSLEGSLDRVLFAAELEFPKILVPRLHQHTSNVNMECVGKSRWSKKLYSLYVTSFLEH